MVAVFSPDFEPDSPRRTGLLDSSRDEAFERLTRLAALALHSPVALIALVDEDGPFLESWVGLPEPLSSPTASRVATAICRSLVDSGRPLVVGDLQRHPLSVGHPVMEGLGAASCAGVPLVEADGTTIGAVCVFDVVPRSWTPDAERALSDVAAAAMTEVEVRRQRVERARTARDAELHRLGALCDEAPAFIAWTRGPHHVFEGTNQAYLRLVGSRDLIGRPVADALPDVAAQGFVAVLDQVLATGEPFVADGIRIVFQRTADGEPEERFLNFVYQPLSEPDGTRSGVFCHGVDVTEQVRVTMALRESESRHRALVETAHEGIWTVDKVGVTTYVNSRLCTMLDYPAAQLLGRSLFDFMAPAFAFEARTLFARRQRGISETLEFELRRRDGKPLHVLMSTSPLTTLDGEFAGALAMVTDITQRREAEQALRESESRYRHVVANAPGMVYQFTYRPDGTKGYTFVSEGARAIFGVEPDAVVRDSNTLLQLVHPDERTGLEQQARAVADVAGDFRWEGRVILPSGEERFVQVVARDQRMPDGAVVSDGLVVDVTEQRRAVEQLQQSEVRFRLAARATNDVVYDWNIATDEHFWGETLHTAFGYDPREFAPTYEWWASLVHPDDVERVTTSLDAVLDGGGEAWTEEYRFRRSDGNYARVLDRSYVLRDEAGTAARLVGSMIDLTAHELLEEQLRQSQKMEAVGRLAGGVAHDFNNLITVIKASTSFLLADMDAVDARCEDVRQIAAAADRAAGLTRQLLAFSRKQILNPRVLAINGVVENVKPMLARLIGEHITVEARLEAGIDSIMADVGQLEQVLINLAVNARDAMPDGGRLTIQTAQVTLDGSYAAGHAAQERTVVLPGQYVMLAVSDTGVGMPRDVQARIFEPFYTTKESGKGTGLGLSTVYGIVKQSGGHIWVYSEPGEGTVFKLYFPRIASAAATPLGQPVIAPPARGTETILLVEDEDALRRLARRILERHGYRVLDSRNGREALERVTQHDGPIHLVLTDVIMPEMSGRGLVERLRAVRPNAGVVYMSGYTDDEVLRRGLFEPGSRFVQKPFVPEELLRIVREVLEPGSDR